MADNQEITVVQGADNLREIFIDRVEGEWHAIRVAGRISYLCDFGVCGTYGGTKFNDRQRLNRHRSLTHGLAEVPERRRGKKPSSDIPIKPSTYSRDRYMIEKRDLNKVLRNQHHNKRYRAIQKWCQSENVKSYDGLSKEAQTAIKEEMQKYEDEENIRKRKAKHLKREDIIARGHLRFEDIVGTCMEQLGTRLEQHIVQVGEDAKNDALSESQKEAGTPSPKVVKEIEHDGA